MLRAMLVTILSLPSWSNMPRAVLLTILSLLLWSSPNTILFGGLYGLTPRIAAAVPVWYCVAGSTRSP
jgi:hypothetical protein